MKEIVATLFAAAGATFLAACSALPGPSIAPPAELEARGCDALADPDRSTFLLFEMSRNRMLVCNGGRAEVRFVPASTYKIPHALLALESGIVTDEHARFPWDGRSRGVPAWNRATSLAEAVRSSTVWVFQDVARRLGHAREAEALRRFGYGNENPGRPEDLRRFWLSGPLAISAREQVAFLARLRSGTLDADRRNQERTVAMLRIRDCGPDCVIYGKTGAVLPIDSEGFLRPDDSSLLPAGIERTGWFVGWAERPEEAGGPIVFAHNLDLAVPGAMAARTSVAFAILRANGVPVDDP